MDARLFVYGSLRPGAGHVLGRSLLDAAASVQHARVEGRLVDLGAYPGMVDARGCGRWVHGELLELPHPPDLDPLDLWASLDRYEELDPPPPARPEYARVRVLVHRGGERLEAWAYRYLGAYEARQLIPSGDWLAHARRPQGS